MGYHVRRAGLPRPGSDRQLQDFVARVQPRKLDRTRPLWEVYLVEGLHDGRFAIVTKTHHALIDGVNALDIAHVIVDAVKGEDARRRRGAVGAEPLAVARSSSLDGRRHRRGAAPDPGRRPRPRGPQRRPQRRPACRRVRRSGALHGRAHGRAPGTRLAPQRRDRLGPPVGHDRDRPRRLPPRAQAPGPWRVRRGRDDQRRRARDDRRRLPRVAARPRRGREPAHVGARHGAGQHLRRRPRRDVCQPGHGLRRQPARRRAGGLDAPAPDRVRDAPADGGRPGGRARRRSPTSPGSRRRPCTPSGPGSARRCRAGSTTS